MVTSLGYIAGSSLRKKKRKRKRNERKMPLTGEQTWINKCLPDLQH
jgi:hypothetical protein